MTRLRRVIPIDVMGSGYGLPSRKIMRAVRALLRAELEAAADRAVNAYMDGIATDDYQADCKAIRAAVLGAGRRK